MAKLNWICVFSAMLGVISSSPCQENNVDFLNNNMVKDIKVYHGIKSAAKCEDLCKKYGSLCYAWSLTLKNFTEDVKNREFCYLKNGAYEAGRRSVAGVVSGRMDCNPCHDYNVDYLHHDIKRVPGIKLAAKCESLCKKHGSGCYAWTLTFNSFQQDVNNRGFCYIKRSTFESGRRSVAGTVSGRMDCDPEYPNPCQRSWEKKGCFHEGRTTMKLLITDREVGGRLNWNKFAKSTHNLACRCAAKARKEGYTYFSIRFYAECWAGKSYDQLEAILGDNSAAPAECVISNSNNLKQAGCNIGDATECVGFANNEYMYKLSDQAQELDQEDQVKKDVRLVEKIIEDISDILF